MPGLTIHDLLVESPQPGTPDEREMRGTFLGLKYMIPAIGTSQGGAIGVYASAAASPKRLAGRLCRGEVRGRRYDLGVRSECAPRRRVRVNVVCPGATSGRDAAQIAAEHPSRAHCTLVKHPLGRVDMGEEVAEAVLLAGTPLNDGSRVLGGWRRTAGISAWTLASKARTRWSAVAEASAMKGVCLRARGRA